jgi:hypothetical protein
MVLTRLGIIDLKSRLFLACTGGVKAVSGS